jgi:CelD/BcsL family acetyltransferase involved in cellulose biosynthesis
MCGHQASWDSLWLSGLDPHGPIFKGLAELAGRQHQLFVGPPTLRRVASLADGLDGYLSRRSSAFRKSLKKTIRRAEEAGVVFQWFPHSPDDASRRSYYSRALAIDDKSWKGLQRAGLREGGMELFYDAMTRYLGAKDQLRVVIAQHDGVDIAMGFGGLLGGTFRGLQMSYDENFRHLGLGNLIQWQFITHLINEGVSQYDLGTEMEYKSRWAEEGLETIPLVIRKMGL